MRVLVTGACSLVGFSMLESLEGRREGLFLIGMASEGDNSERARFDHFEIVPESRDPLYPQTLERIVDVMEPDLVLPARDDDISRLAELGASRPGLASRLVVGSPSSARVITDKGVTATFARDHDLRWADTLVCGPTADPDGFAARNPLPWIAKPVDGAGSRGVFLITRSGQADAWVPRRGYVIQPLLGPPRGDLEPSSTDPGVPWFTDIGDPWLRSVQVVVLPDGSVGPSFCSDHTLKGGHPQTSAVATDPDAVAIATRWASSLARGGWRGSLNIQMKVDPRLGPVPFEINGRVSGATHGRLKLGFDEMGILFEAWTGWSLPRRSASAAKVFYRPRAYP